MFSYAPSARLSSPFSYSPTPTSIHRDRYLAALAEAKAAEAELLAAEAAQREEEDLRRRLQEIEYRKYQQQLQSPYDRIPYGTLDSYSSYDRLVDLRQRVEAEERLRLVALREAEAAERRRQTELALTREKAYRRRRQQEQQEQARIAALLKQSVEVARHHCACGNQASQASCRQRRQQPNAAIHPTLRGLLSPQAGVSIPTEPVCFCQPAIPQEAARISLQKPQVSPEDDNLFKLLLKQFLEAHSEAKKPDQPAPKPTQKLDYAPEQFLELMFKSLGTDQRPTQQKQDLEATKPKEAPGKPAPVAPIPTPPASSKAALKEKLEGRIGNELHSEVRDTIQAIFTSLQDSVNNVAATASTPPPKESTSGSSTKAVPVTPEHKKAPAPLTISLKEQLEARLGNEFHSEVRDTIQAIVASLQDAEDHARDSTPSPTPFASSKGKAKAEGSTSTPASTTNPTSKDVMNSLNEVRNIEAAFHALEAEFTFPSTLDFIAAHLVAGNPASSDSESSSATTHLAYTSRNHPVRFYEQALSTLLNQLDSVDSFGNDELRASRKEIVRQVEKALEELEKEVEGRFRTRLSKEAKAAAPSETRSTTPSAEVSAPTTSSGSTTTTSALSHSSTTTSSTSPDSTIKSTPETEAASAPVPSESLSEDQAAVTAATTDETLAQQEPEASATLPEPAAESTLDHALPAAKPTPIVTDEPSASLSSSSTTIKGYEVDSNAEAADEDAPATGSSHTEPDAFLLASKPAPIRPTNKDSDDVGSDWSELDA